MSVATAPLTLQDEPAVEWEPALAPAPAAAAGVDRLVWLLGGLLAAAAFLRVWQLGAVGFNSDETVYIGQGAAICG